MRNVVGVAIFVAVALTGALAAAPDATTISIGEDQVARGARVYASNCASCHGESLEGFGPFPALAGRVFRERWAERPLVELHTVVAEQMPLTAPGSLSAEQYSDVLAFILARNGVEAGETELDPAAEGALDALIAFGD